MMNFTKEQIKELRVGYKNAVIEGLEQFPFRGDIIVTAYAKYLLEYLDSQNK
jgi:hypothetical protein